MALSPGTAPHQPDFSADNRSPASLLFFAISLLPYVVLSIGILLNPEMPLIDVPNHTARADLIVRLATDPFARGLYEYQFRFVPYIFGDLYVALFVKAFGPFLGAKVCAIVTLLLTPAAWLFLLWCWGAELRRVAPIALLLTSYIATNYFYLNGYISFCLSASLALFGLGTWELWSRAEGRNAWTLYAVYTALLVIAYLSHLAGFFFLGAFAGSLALYRLLRRSMSFLSAALSAAPIIGLSAAHVLLRRLGSHPSDEWAFRGFAKKFLALGSPVARYNFPVDTLLLGLFAAIVTAMLFAGRNSVRTKAVAELALLSVLSVILYFVLPYSFGPAAEVDQRALFFLYLFCFAAGVLLAPPDFLRLRPIITAVILLAFSNTVFVCFMWLSTEKRLGEYREALYHVPEGKRLLPVYTWDRIGRIDVGLHYGEWYSVLRRGYAPDIFNNTTSPNQFPYFLVKGDVYTPGSHWYVRRKDDSVKWDRIAELYDYLLVTKPFIRERLKVELEPVYENSSVSVFRMAGAR